MPWVLSNERVRTLPVRPDELWQGGLLRIPGGPAVDDDGTMVEPAACVWISAATGRVHMGPIGPAEAVTPAVVVEQFVAFATDATLAGYRPGRIEVADPAHAAALAAILGPAAGTAVSVIDRLDGLAFLSQQLGVALPQALMGGGGEPAALTDDPAVTPDRLAGFADAAAAFFRAKPWKRLVMEDLVEVLAPATVPEHLRFVNVMGSGGEQFGLAFFDSAASFAALITAAEPVAHATSHPMRSVTFDTADRLPPGDVLAWKRLKRTAPLKLRGRVVYPFPVTFDVGRWVRPTAVELAVMEGLLRALATVPKAGPAGDRWAADVATADGPVRFEFRMLDGTAGVS